MKKIHGKISLSVVLIIFLTVALAGSAGTIAWLMLGDGMSGGEGAEEAKPVEVVDPIFVKIGPMTLNINSQRGDRLLYISMMIKVGNEATESFLTLQTPDINNRMLILLSEQYAEELTAPGGKEVIAEKILEELQVPFSDPQPELSIQGVLFQDFIVQ